MLDKSLNGDAANKNAGIRTVVLDGPEERKRWNLFVARSVHGHFMQTWEWGDFKCRMGWKSSCVAVEQDGRIGCLSSGRGAERLPRIHHRQTNPATFLRIQPSVQLLQAGFRTILEKAGLFTTAGQEGYPRRLSQRHAVP